jgi:sodium/pantothenate symporter
MNPYLIGVIISIVIYMLIGNLAGRSVKNVDDYYVSGRNAGTLLISGTLIASMMSTSSFIGDTAWTYDGNIGLMTLLNIGTAAGYVLGPLYFGRYLRRSEVITMPEFFGKRFNSRTMHTVSGITAFVVLIAYLVAVTKGTSILLSNLTGFSSEICMLIAFVCFASFTFYSGSKGVILTDTIMFIVFVIATMLTAPVVFEIAGGFNDLVTNVIQTPGVSSEVFAWHGVTEGVTVFDNFGYALATGILWMCAVCVSPWQASRGMMAKNEHVGIRAGSVAAIATFVFMPIIYLLGVSMNVVNPNIVPSESVMIYLSMNLVPTFIGVFMLVGVAAAGLSSASTFLSLAAFSATNDIVEIDFKSDKQKLMMSRVIMLVVGVVALIIAYMDLAVLRVISWFAASAVASSWTIVGIGSIWSKKLTSRGAIWSMASGFISCMFFTIGNKFGWFTIPMWLHPFYFAIIIAFIGAWLGSRNGKISKEEADFVKKIHIMPESERDLNLLKKTKKYGYALIATGIFLSTFLILWWALPYNNIVI